MKHTPGPWSVGTRKPYVEVWGPMRMNASPILASMESEPREANARLMAAAPDLYRALDELAGFVSDQFGDQKSDDGWKTEEARDAWMKARAVLEKAQSSG